MNQRIKHPPPDLSVYPAVWQSSEPFELESGEILPQAKLVMGHYGRLNSARDNAVLLTTGLSASYHAGEHASRDEPGWWSRMIGPGKPLDTNRFFIVCMNPLGGCFGSTGPSSTDPRTGRPYGMSFPVFSMRDIMELQYRALRALGVERLFALVGSSMGGLLALQLAADHPDFVSRLLAISCSAYSSDYAAACRYVQRRAIMNDPAWRNGAYDPEHAPREGLRIARMIGTMSYRSHLELNPRFHREAVSEPEPFGITYQVESFLDHLGDVFAERFDANSYLYLTRSMDDFDIGRGYESRAAALERIRARTTIVGVTSDSLFPPRDQRELHESIARANPDTRLVILDSSSGHDAFLKDYELFIPLAGEFLA